MIISPLIEIDLILYKIIRVTVSNLNIRHLKKNWTVRLFWLLGPFFLLNSLHAVGVVVEVEEAEVLPTQAVVVVLVEEDLVRDPLEWYRSMDHNMVQYTLDSLKAVSVQRASLHAFALSALSAS